jgi:hypothetical protein
MIGVEVIRAAGALVGYVIRADAATHSTSFITPDEVTLQAGFVVYGAGGEVTPHVHLPIERNIVGTSEFLLVRSGRCVVDFYDAERHLIASTTLGPGDAVLSVSGGHGFQMTEDTVLLELKQGPFVGGTEKERFRRSESTPVDS